MEALTAFDFKGETNETHLALEVLLICPYKEVGLYLSEMHNPLLIVSSILLQ